MVAALSRARHGPASRSAALSSTAARSSRDSARHPGAASAAALIAALASAWPELAMHAEHVLVIVWLRPPRSRGPCRCTLRPPMVALNVCWIRLQPRQLGLELRALRAARCVVQVRLVERRRGGGDGVHGWRWCQTKRPLGPRRAVGPGGQQVRDLLGGEPGQIILVVDPLPGSTGSPTPRRHRRSAAVWHRCRVVRLAEDTRGPAVGSSTSRRGAGPAGLSRASAAAAISAAYSHCSSSPSGQAARSAAVTAWAARGAPSDPSADSPPAPRAPARDRPRQREIGTGRRVTGPGHRRPPGPVVRRARARPRGARRRWG